MSHFDITVQPIRACSRLRPARMIHTNVPELDNSACAYPPDGLPTGLPRVALDRMPAVV